MRNAYTREQFWTLDGYRKSSAGVICLLTAPGGALLEEPLSVFASKAAERAWSNDSGDIDAMVKFAQLQAQKGDA